MNLPDEMLEMAKELAVLANKYRLRKIQVTASPPFEQWEADVHFQWEAGRHSEDSHRMHVVSELREMVSVKL